MRGRVRANAGDLGADIDEKTSANGGGCAAAELDDLKPGQQRHSKLSTIESARPKSPMSGTASTS
jgi:hypothetical protein